MTEQHELTTVKRNFGDEKIDVLYRKATPIDAPESRYPGFHPHTYTLAKGTVMNTGALPLPCDIICNQDVAIPMRDGITLYADIFRPAEENDLPAIIAWGPFGKRGGTSLNQIPGRSGVPKDAVSDLQSWEGPDPAYWCNHGYAIVNVDARGVASSEGDIHFWGTMEAQDGYDTIEWLAAQSWCNGKVTLSGNSWLAIVQWFIAALQPPHLTAIAPWEGHIDLYRCDVLRGGIQDYRFNERVLTGLRGRNRIEDMPAMVRKYPLMNGYWEDKEAKLEKITIPAYVVASLSAHHTIDGFPRIGSKEKWLRVHNTNEWFDYYTPEYTEDLRRFYDYYLKGIQNGWETTPKVRLSVINPGGTDEVDRPEIEWPLKRIRYQRLYLDAQLGKLSFEPIPTASNVGYSVENGEGKTMFTITFDKDTEITGNLTLHLWAEADGSDDMDLFVNVSKWDAQNSPQRGASSRYAGPDGRLRASHRQLDTEKSKPGRVRHTHRMEELLSPGQIVSMEIPIRATSMRWHAGEQLVLTISGPLSSKAPEGVTPQLLTRNKGGHIIHTGGKYDSYLLVPIIPG